MGIGRGRLLGFTALAVTAGLLAVTVPVGAVDGRADHTAAQQACPGDLVNNSVAHATGCLESLGITERQAVAAFTVGITVRRAAMALALVNTARAAGVEIPDNPGDHGFEDIQDCSLCSDPATVNAINQLVALGITKGKTATRFDPDGTVTRQQMALFFTRLLALVPVGEDGMVVAQVVPDDNVFSDIADLSDEAGHAIGVLYELGITKGATASTYSPSKLVTGGQMALFLTRLLAHTTARGEGGTTLLTVRSALEHFLSVYDTASRTDRDHQRAETELEARYEAAVASSDDPDVKAAVAALAAGNEAYNAAYGDCILLNFRHDPAEEACIAARGEAGSNARMSAIYQLLTVIENSSDPVIRAIVDDASVYLTSWSGLGLSSAFAGKSWAAAGRKYSYNADVGLMLRFDSDLYWAPIFEAMDVVRAFGINALDNAWIAKYPDPKGGRYRLGLRLWDTYLLEEWHGIPGIPGILASPARDILDLLDRLNHIPEIISNGGATFQEYLDLLDLLGND